MDTREMYNELIKSIEDHEKSSLCVYYNWKVFLFSLEKKLDEKEKLENELNELMFKRELDWTDHLIIDDINKELDKINKDIKVDIPELKKLWKFIKTIK